MARGAPQDSQNSFTTVQRVSPTQQVREQLIAAIENGDYPPGAPLPSERVLCDSFGVSRVSVREALAGLEAMKLIVIQHGRGAFVRIGADDEYAGPFAKYIELHRTELVELTKVRGALDELAAEDVARFGSAEDLATIVGAGEAFAEAAERGDHAEAAALDLAFHLSIADSVHGKLLPRLIHELNEVLTESRVATFAQAGQLELSIQEHRAITDALGDRDPQAARTAVHQHMTRISDWLEARGSAADEVGGAGQARGSAADGVGGVGQARGSAADEVGGVGRAQRTAADGVGGVERTQRPQTD